MDGTTVKESAFILTAVYEGDFTEDECHGKGTLTLPDGTMYSGDFSGDTHVDSGMTIWPDGKLSKSGFGGLPQAC